MRSICLLLVCAATTLAGASCRGKELREPPVSARPPAQKPHDHEHDHENEQAAPAPMQRTGGGGGGGAGGKAGTGGGAKAATPSGTGDLARGQVAYLENCARCHGLDGRAQTTDGRLAKATNISEPAVQQRLSDDALTAVITQGKGKMKAVPLDEASLRGVIAFVRRLAR